MSNVRLRDIAEKLGVSVTTVSRALAGYNDVAPGTRQLVLQTAREMGYYPNLTARHLQRRRTDTIGLVVDVTGPRFSDPLFSELLAGVGNQAAREGFDLFVATTLPNTEDELQAYRRLVRGRRVDGIIVVRTRVADRRVQFLLDHQFPFITFGRSTLADHLSWVDVDGEQGVRLVVERLIAAGHRHIAMLQPDLPFMFALFRERGYRHALQAHGLTVEQGWIVHQPLTEDGGYQGMRRLLQLPVPPTAVVASNDQMAIGAIRASEICLLPALSLEGYSTCEIRKYR
ncbi:MAG: LacI family DNA-binding transcriptional regulator [Ardenticatenia bacterium]|nr:LacI family DNA-binding transcriptional regulator [Ardenticatenia bacterium]